MTRTPQPPPELTGRTMPCHVAFIMDGNGRWAKQQGLPRSEGHRAGVDAVREVLEAARDWGIRWISLYAFSTENWRRPSEEVSTLFGLLADYVTRELPNFLRDGVRLHVLGELDPLPVAARDAVREALRQTAHLDQYHVLLAVNYGGREEILRAVRRWAADTDAPAAESLDEAAFAGYLDTAGAPDPDLMIRTSGEQRLSNFLLWQNAYSEFLFVPEAWPDFGADGFRRALETYAGRTRRFGMTDEQVRTA